MINSSKKYVSMTENNEQLRNSSHAPDFNSSILCKMKFLATIYRNGLHGNTTTLCYKHFQLDMQNWFKIM